MKVVIQRVAYSKVIIDNQVVGEINNGILVLIGIVNDDSFSDIDWIIKKIIQLRIFEDENNIMNLSVQDINGEILVVSQFTLHALTKKGNRPSYINAAKPEIAIPIYNEFIKQLEVQFCKKIEKGIFGADMKVHLINDGPVTIIIDSKNKE